jgi:hypothetical protein
MNQCYILSWAPYFHGTATLVDRQQLLDLLDTIPGVINWRTASGVIFLVTNNPTDVFEKLRAKFPSLFFAMAAIKIESTWGWGDPVTWEFIRRPRKAGDP